MRRAMTPAILGLLSATAMTCLCAAPAPTAAPVPAKSLPPLPQMVVPQTVYLNGVADLEHLRATNLHHYLRAKKILAAANEICRPGAPRTYSARFSDADPQCGAMWMTSFPPKKRLTFHLDGVHYVALVTVTADTGKLVQVHDLAR